MLNAIEVTTIMSAYADSIVSWCIKDVNRTIINIITIFVVGCMLLSLFYVACGIIILIAVFFYDFEINNEAIELHHLIIYYTLTIVWIYFEWQLIRRLLLATGLQLTWKLLVIAFIQRVSIYILL